MTTPKGNDTAIYVEWRDPQKELPDANSYVLAAFSWSGCEEDYEILYFDGEGWHDDYECTFTVLAWMPIPKLPKGWTTNQM